MCGICGYTGQTDTPAIEKMVERLYHRGPDDLGLWQDNGIALGIRRLAIVDIEDGQQPVSNEDGSIVAVFNGEIYNHAVLREGLQKRGHRFRSHHCDSEVIVHLYEEHGPSFLKYLNGMFAIAIWDSQKRRVFLARDRAGIKPLYYSLVAGRLANKQLVFASEIKSLLSHPAISIEPNYDALSHYFCFKNIPAPMSAFSGIEQLRPGEYLLFENQELERRRWWKLPIDEPMDIDEPDAVKEIQRLLSESVELRTASDVPVGAYLSGGVDSSAIVALLSDKISGPLKTFTLTYNESFTGKNSDKNFARLVSQIYGTQHYEYELSPTEVAESFEGILSAFDEPYSGVTSTYYLTKLISDHVKVALSGDGADELFGSYLSHRMAACIAYEGGSATNGRSRRLQRQYDLSPSVVGKLASCEGESDLRMALYLASDAEKANFLTPNMRSLSAGGSSGEIVKEVFSQVKTQDVINRFLYLDFETLLPDQVLAFVDRLSMAHSVEVRTPFLDYRLMEFVARLPGKMKMVPGRVKNILKEAVTGLLPPELIDRPKEGFVMPVNEWLLKEYEPLVLGVLSRDRVEKVGVIDSTYVTQLLKEHYEDHVQHGSRIWNFLMFQLWWEKYFD